MHNQAISYSFTWSSKNTIVDRNSFPNGFVIKDTVYSNDDIDVETYVTSQYHDIFTKLSPMSDVSV
jgi:hypothetical protein